MTYTLKSYEEYQRHNLSLAISKLTALSADKATIHHADFSRHRVLGKAGADDDDETVVEYLHRWHYEENKWRNGIGYHGVILPDGRFLLLYRGLKGITGAHVGRHNSGNIGILVWGDFNEEEITDEQEDTIIQLRLLLEAICGIEKYYLHRDLNNTSCPGKNFPDNLWLV